MARFGANASKAALAASRQKTLARTELSDRLPLSPPARPPNCAYTCAYAARVPFADARAFSAEHYENPDP